MDQILLGGFIWKLFQAKALKVERVRSSPAAENSVRKPEETKANKSPAMKAGDMAGLEAPPGTFEGQLFQSFRLLQATVSLQLRSWQDMSLPPHTTDAARPSEVGIQLF